MRRLVLFFPILWSLVLMPSAEAFLSFRLTLHSEVGDSIGQGQDWLFTNVDGALRFLEFAAGDATGDGIVDRIALDFLGNAPGVFWNLELFTDQLGVNLVPGVYLDAERAVFASPGHPGLAFSLNGSGCSTLTGSFTIISAVFDYSGPRPRFVDFIATFEQHCEGRVPALLGRLEMSDTAMPVAIDIKPHSSDNVLNLESAGVIPVAILSSATFDATTVDPTTVTLAGAKVRLLGKGTQGSCGPDDVNRDGLMDLVCHVETAALFILPGDSVAILEATTFSGDAIRGQDSIRIVKEQEF